MCVERERERVWWGVTRAGGGRGSGGQSQGWESLVEQRRQRFESALRLLRETVKRRLLPELGLKNF